DFPLVGAFADQGAKEGRLPGPVEPDEGGNPVTGEVGIDPVEDGTAAEDDAQVSDRGEGEAHRRARASSRRFFVMVSTYRSADSSRSSHVSSGSTSAKTASIGFSFNPRSASRMTRADVWLLNWGSTAITRTLRAWHFWMIWASLSAPGSLPGSTSIAPAIFRP